MADKGEKKSGQKHETKGNIQEKVGNVLHSDKLKAKGEANKIEGREQYPREEAKADGAGAKDAVVGKAKAVTGGLLGKEDLKKRGEAQESHGDAKQATN